MSQPDQRKQPAELSDRLIATVRSYGSCVVAFSGGVDSSVVAKAAHLALSDDSVAVTGVGPAVAQRELATAREVARQIGIRHVERKTDEIEQPQYIANAGDRCYHCKTELYAHAMAYAAEHGVSVVANGTNTDDLGDYRPGLTAANEQDIKSPLVECGIDKQGVRALAAYWQLPVADKPASPCLASRLAIGVEVTAQRLMRVEEAEDYLFSLGVADCRVRYHADDLARIEVPTDEIARLCESPVREQLEQRLRAIGFRHITIDMGGLQSGSLNPVGFAELRPFVG